MNVQSKLHRLHARDALLVGIGGGILGVLIDADHFLWGGREWHLSVFLIGGLILCCCGAYLGGLLIKMVLKGPTNRSTRPGASVKYTPDPTGRQRK